MPDVLVKHNHLDEAKPPVPYPNPDKTTDSGENDWPDKTFGTQQPRDDRPDCTKYSDTHPEHKLGHMLPVRTRAECGEQHNTRNTDNHDEKQHSIGSKLWRSHNGFGGLF